MQKKDISLLKPFCALLGLTILLTGGCGRVKPPPDVSRSVRTEDLLSLHPLWKNVEAFDRRLATFEGKASTRFGPLAPLPISSLPPLAYRETPAENLSKQRQDRIKTDTEKYLAQLETYLRGNAKQRLAGEVRNLSRAREAEIQKKIAARVLELTAETEKRRTDIKSKLRPLQYRAVAYGSQLKITLGLTHDAIDKALKATNTEIERLIAEDSALPTDFLRQAQQQFSGERNRARQEVEAFRLRRQRELDAEVNGQITSRTKLLSEQRTAIPSLDDMPTIPSLPETQRAVGELPKFLSMPTAETSGARPDARTETEWAKQRAKLVATIRRDTEQAVLQEAQREGWTLVPAGTAGSVDATEEVRPLLIAQWKR